MDRGTGRPRSGSALTTDDWVWLNPNDRVKLQRENEAIAAVFIDVVAPDASIFWVWLDGGRGRVALQWTISSASDSRKSRTNHTESITLMGRALGG
jgi:hypothetical protein